uniref:Phosphomannose isomerase type I catalytic domain-containing protein n=1 Tax=Amphimedon queenslandica TaxID=400682 RepID=A0A1X7T0Y9_AMPQE
MDYSTIPTIDIICCTEKCTELEKCIEINSTLEEMKIDFDRQDKISIVSVIKGVTRNKTIKSLTLKHFASLPGGLIEQFLKDKDTLQALSLDFLYHFLPSSNIEVNTPLNALEKVVDKFGPNLLFLFKVLSINKALSIQGHPSIPLKTTPILFTPIPLSIILTLIISQSLSLL